MKGNVYIILALVYSLCLSTTVVYGQEKMLLEKDMFDDFIHREFSKIITGNDLDAGNFINLNLTEAKVDFGISKVFNNGSILTFKGAGAVTEGVLPLFDNSKVNSSFELGLKLDILQLTDQKIVLKSRERRAYQEKIFNINQEFAKAIFKIQPAEILSQKYKNKLDSLNNHLEETIDQLEEFKRIIPQNEMNNIKNVKVKAYLNLRKDSLNTELLINEIERKAKNILEPTTQWNELDNDRIDKEEEARKALTVYDFSLQWWSIGLSLKSSSFNIFDRSLSTDKQIIEESTYDPILSINHNWYHAEDASGFNNYFISSGISLTFKSNFNALKKRTIEERDPIDTSTNRELVNTRTVYEGNLEKNIFRLNFYTDLFWFFNFQRTKALHIRPHVDIDPGNTNNFSLVVGYVMAFRNQDNNANKTNVELAFKINDLLNQSAEVDGFFDRLQIGLDFSFPLDFTK